MDFPAKIKTIKNFSETKFKEKGSTFIGQAFQVISEEEAMNILSEIKKKYYDATHHCYALKLQDGFVKYSDDSEPNGTAGIRILNAIEHFDLVNLLVVSIRYFGGTKLGVGPLGKAYYQSAFDALESAKIVEKTAFRKMDITVDFSMISQIHHTLASFTSKIEDIVYKENVTFKCLLIPGEIKTFEKNLTDATNGSALINISSEIVYL